METWQRLALENVLEVPFLTNFRRRKRDLFFGNRSCNLYILAFPYLYDIADGLPADWTFLAVSGTFQTRTNVPASVKHAITRGIQTHATFSLLFST